MAINDHGTIDNWGLEDSSHDVLEDGSTVHSADSIEQADKFFKIMEPYLKKVYYSKITAPKVEQTSKGFILADGSAITNVWMTPSRCNSNTSYCGDFYLKTQGKENNETKSPYVFNFLLYKNKIVPNGTDETTFKNKCLNRTNYSRCTAWVIYNENMDYLHCTDLSWNGKHKCK